MQMKKRTPAQNALHLLSSVLLSVGGFVLFITTFFFYLGAWIETQALETQILEITATFVDSSGVQFLDQHKLLALKTTLQNSPLPDMTLEDAEAAAKNAMLQKDAFNVMYPLGSGIVLLGIIVIIVQEIYLPQHPIAPQRGRSKINWIDVQKHLVKALWMTVLMVGGIFLTEVAFTLLVSKRYQTVSAAWVKQRFIQTLMDARKKSALH